jgi:ABC-type transporter Mla subunit MlaD
LGKLAVGPEGEKVFADLAAAAGSARALATRLEQDVSREDTVLAAILRDPKGREKLTETLSSLAQASTALAAASQELATGQGTLPRLLRDREFADSFLADLAQLTHALASVADKLDRGQGSAGRMVNDPQLYEDLESVVRGVQQSRLLRWFVRNRREAGERASATPTPGGG